jgi:WD40 repeat protein
MAIQSASAQIITTFKSAVVPLKILTTDIFELGSSTNNPISFVFVCSVVRRQGFFVTLSSAFTCQAARNNMPGFLVAGFLNKTPVRQGDIFYDNTDLTEAQKNYGINLISQATMNIRVPTRVVIDIAKIQIPIIASSQYTIELAEGFFRQSSRISTVDPKLTNTNNQMPTLLNAPLVTLKTNGRPFFLLVSPTNGTTSSYINTKVTLKIFSTTSDGSTGSDILNTLIPGQGNIRLYREGVLVSTLSCFSNKVTFIQNTIQVDYTGLLDANKNYYILIDNGFAVDRDGFATQAVTSNTQCFFKTALSTDTEFPDLVSLQVSAGAVILSQSEIMIYGNANIVSTASISASLQELQIGTGTSTPSASLFVTPNVTRLFAGINASLGTLFCNPEVTKRATSNQFIFANISKALMGRKEEAASTMSAFTFEIDLMGFLLNPNAIPMSVVSTASITGNHRLRRMTRTLTSAFTTTQRAFKIVRFTTTLTSSTALSCNLSIVEPVGTRYYEGASGIDYTNHIWPNSTNNPYVYGNNSNFPGGGNAVWFDVSPNRQTIVACYSTSNGVYLRTWYRDNASMRYNAGPTQSGTEGGGFQVQISPNNNLIAYRKTQGFNGSGIYGIQIYNTGLTLQSQFNPGEDVLGFGGLAWGPNSDRIAAGYYDSLYYDNRFNDFQGVRVFNTGGTQIADYTLGANPLICAYNPSGSLLAIGTERRWFNRTTNNYQVGDDALVIINTSNGSRITLPYIPQGSSLSYQSEGVTRMAWSHNGSYLAVASRVAPYLTIYKVTGTTFTLLTYTGGFSLNLSISYLSFNSDSTILDAGGAIVSRDGDVFTQESNVITFGGTPSGVGGIYRGF